MKLRTLEDLDVEGKRVLVRADLNVPLAGGQIADDFRIRSSLGTLREVLERGTSQLIVCSHLGRPKGMANPKYSLAPVAERLGELLGRPVALASGPLGPVPDAPVVLLENLRFDPGEEKNSPEFAGGLAALADRYVDDAFGAAHRAHASIVGVAERLPSAAGRLLQREVEVLGDLLESPERPFAAVLGGAKVSDKLKVIENLLRRVDTLLIGGGMCFTFLAARGLEIGTSLFEPEQVTTVAKLLGEAGERLVVPTDVVAATEATEHAARHVVAAGAIPADEAGFDIGPETSAAYAGLVAGSRTVFWNGPMGVFEVPGFGGGTEAVARAIADGPAYSVVGGGDSALALDRLGLSGKIDHVSTGGGASLEFLESGTLVGLAPLLA